MQLDSVYAHHLYSKYTGTKQCAYSVQGHRQLVLPQRVSNRDTRDANARGAALTGARRLARQHHRGSNHVRLVYSENERTSITLGLLDRAARFLRISSHGLKRFPPILLRRDFWMAVSSERRSLICDSE